MTAVRHVLADTRHAFGARYVAVQLVGGAVCCLAGFVVVLGLAVLT